jgi:glycine betaine catabolism B
LAEHPSFFTHTSIIKPMIPAVIRNVTQATPTIRTLRIEPHGEFTFKAGQWIDFYADVAGERRVAGYSITSSPLTQGHFDLAVKKMGENPVTRYIHTETKEEDIVHIDGGNGQIFYEAGDARNVVLLADGIGISPHMSIFRYIFEGDSAASVTLVYSAASPSEFLFREEIEETTRRDPRMRALLTVTDKASDWSGRVGRINADLIREAGVNAEALYYICGPTETIHELVDILRGLGIRRKQMRYELWW